MGVVRPRTPTKAALSARAAARQKAQLDQQQQASLGKKKSASHSSSCEQRPTAASSLAVSPPGITAIPASNSAVHIHIFTSVHAETLAEHALLQSMHSILLCVMQLFMSVQ